MSTTTWNSTLHARYGQTYHLLRIITVVNKGTLVWAFSRSNQVSQFPELSWMWITCDLFSQVPLHVRCAVLQNIPQVINTAAGFVWERWARVFEPAFLLRSSLKFFSRTCWIWTVLTQGAPCRVLRVLADHTMVPLVMFVQLEVWVCWA